MKKNKHKKQHKQKSHDDALSVKDRLNSSLFQQLQEKKNELAMEEKKRQEDEENRKREERRQREKNKSFEELLNESNLNWDDYK
nr:YqkE family protein [Bacillus sp. SM2101]